MRTSCPPGSLGPSLPTQALLGCPEQEAALRGVEKPFPLVLVGLQASFTTHRHEKLPGSLLYTPPEPNLRDNCLPH